MIAREEEEEEDDDKIAAHLLMYTYIIMIAYNQYDSCRLSFHHDNEYCKYRSCLLSVYIHGGGLVWK
jgi:hypothetical protein